MNKSTKYVYWIWILKIKHVYFNSLDNSVGLESVAYGKLRAVFDSHIILNLHGNEIYYNVALSISDLLSVI